MRKIKVVSKSLSERSHVFSCCFLLLFNQRARSGASAVTYGFTGARLASTVAPTSRWNVYLAERRWRLGLKAAHTAIWTTNAGGGKCLFGSQVHLLTSHCRLGYIIEIDFPVSTKSTEDEQLQFSITVRKGGFFAPLDR